jgi:hypothetical protein
MIDHGFTHEQIDQEFTCDHLQSRITYLITRAGTKLFRRQCLRCGQQVAVLRKGDLSQTEMDAAIPHDEALQPAWWRRKNERHKALRDQVETRRANAVAREAEEREREQVGADAAWRARYNAHLLSPK